MKSIQFWIALQRQLDEFNNTEAYREYRQWERAHFQQCKRRQPNNCECGAVKKFAGPPKVDNLKVIPICSYKRTHFTIDSHTLWSILCGAKIVPRDYSKSANGRNVPSVKFTSKKTRYEYWNMFIKMPKIKWMGGKKKNFDFRLLSNGQAVSILYDIKKIKPKPFNKEKIVQDYKNGAFKNESGTDPGVNTWLATTLRNIETGKEVNNS